ncbi:MAG: phospholipid carrier-dependent glycosyltransferase [Mariniphaga sp.]
MNRRNFQIILLFVGTIIAFVVNNGALEANIMEARNLTTAREILQKNNWLEPTMNGELRLEKPPLPTWLTAVTMYFVGQNDLSLLRLPAALAGMLLVFFLYKLTIEITEDKLLPFLVAGTATTSFYIFFLARDISWDIFCHSFMIGAIWLIVKGLKSKSSGWPELLGAGVLMGLSFMSKGPVSFYALLLPFLIAQSLTFGWKEATHKKKALWGMIVLTLVISLWWPLMIWISHPDFSALIAKQESLAWINRSTRPFYHYWSFPIQSGIWAIFASCALIFSYAKTRINQYGNYNFLLIWILSSLILLSLFPEKKERYLLPVLLPLAMLTAFYMRYLISAFKEGSFTRTDLNLFRSQVFIMSLIGIMLPVSVFVFLKAEKRPDMITLVLIAVLFWGTAIYILSSLPQKNAFRLWTGMVAIVLFVCLTIMPLAPKIAITNPSYRSYQELRRRTDVKVANFYFNKEMPGKFIEVVWNSGHTIKLWDTWNNPQMPSKLPILFLSYEDPTTVLPADILSNYQIEIIGRFDSNPGKTRKDTALVNYATLITEPSQ